MDYDYLSSIVSNYTNLSALSNKIGSSSNVSSIKDVMNTLSSGDSFSGLLNSAVQAISNDYSSESIDSAIRAITANTGSGSITGMLDSMVKSSGVDDDTADKLAGIAGVNTSNGTEREARSSLIMQNYLTASIMKDTLQNSLTDSADFTQALFSGLAVGSGEDDSSNSTLSSLQNSTLSAISNMTAYEDYLDKQVG